MVNVTRLLTVRLTESEYAMLCDEAKEKDRTLSYVAREKIREGIKREA